MLGAALAAELGRTLNEWLCRAEWVDRHAVQHKIPAIGRERGSTEDDMRTEFGVVSAVWFLGAALLIGDGRFGTTGDPPNEEVLGDPVVMAVYFIGRLLFVGLGLLSLSFVDWSSLGKLTDRLGASDED